MSSKELEEYRRLVKELEAICEARKPGNWQSNEDVNQTLAVELDAKWLKLSKEERRGEEPMLVNGLAMEAHSQRGYPLTLVGGHMYLCHPHHVPVIEEVSWSERSAETHYTDGYTMVLRLEIKGPRRDFERAPLIGFVKAHSFEKTFTNVPPRHVVLMYGSQVITATAVEEANWVQKRIAYRKASEGPSVERWGVWLSSERWLTWDDGEDWVGTKKAAEEEAENGEKFEARPYKRGS